MWLLISLGLSVIYAILKPFGDGLFDTSLWLAKITMPPDMDKSQITKQLLKVNQAALLGDWLSNFPFINTIIVVLSIISGFLYSWWAGIMMYFIAVFLGATSKFFFTRPVVYYLFVIYHSMTNREANYKMKNDISRAEAAKSYCEDLAEIIAIYENSKLKPPSEKKVKSIPHGDIFYLIQSN
jgi:hypothetical protein